MGPSRELAEKWTEKSSTIKDSMKKHGGERGVVTKKLAASGEDEIREGGKEHITFDFKMSFTDHDKNQYYFCAKF